MAKSLEICKKALILGLVKSGIILFSGKIGQNSLKTDYCLSSDGVERV